MQREFQMRTNPLMKTDLVHEYVFSTHSPAQESWVYSILKNRKLNRILDLGCGRGLWGFLFRTYIAPDAEIIGVDISADKIGRLKKLNVYDKLIVEDVFKLATSGNFDLIMVGGILHSLDAKKFLSIFESKLAKDGVLMIAGPSDLGLRKTLLERGYSVYEYYLRGLILFNTKVNETISLYPTMEIKILTALFKFYKKLLKRNNVEIIAFVESQ
jgi:SAM-dependent methyltransferase